VIDVRSALEAERVTLRRELEAITAVPRDPAGTVSFGKRVGEGTSQAVERIAQVSAARTLSAKLVDVERALEKLDEGTYGICDDLGEPIDAERLGAIPWAVLCRSCARARTSAT
jgi:DnaK suppressor protein